MALGAFVQREMITSVRRGIAFSDRWKSVVSMAAAVAGYVVLWDWLGWDRGSATGVRSFALSAFGLIITALAISVLGVVPTLIAPAIAAERDRKTLDSLLATSFSAADVVLGAIGAGLVRYANGLAVLGPILTMLAILGRIDPRLILLAGAGLASMAFVLAALAAAVSVAARTADRASTTTSVLALVWISGPGTIMIVLPRVWPAAVPWVDQVADCIFDSSPLSVGLNLIGVIDRGPLVDVVLTMIALQTAATVVLVLWGMARLRPASRAAHDAEGRTALRHLLQARWRPRPPCGDDPILWRELYPRPAASGASWLVNQLLRVFWVGLFACLISWVAVPAFAELCESGYGATMVAPLRSERDPISDLLVDRLTGLPGSTKPGQARLRFNLVLRQATGPEPVAVLRECRVPAALEDLQDRLLDQAIQHGGDAELAHPAVRFGQFDSPHRLRSISPVEQLSPDGWPVLTQVVPGLVDGPAIDAGAPLVGADLMPRPFEVISFAHLLNQRLDSRRVFGSPLRRG